MDASKWTASGDNFPILLPVAEWNATCKGWHRPVCCAGKAGPEWGISGPLWAEMGWAGDATHRQTHTHTYVSKGGRGKGSRVNIYWHSTSSERLTPTGNKSERIRSGVPGKAAVLCRACTHGKQEERGKHGGRMSERASKGGTGVGVRLGISHCWIKATHGDFLKLAALWGLTDGLCFNYQNIPSTTMFFDSTMVLPFDIITALQYGYRILY